MKYPFLFHSLPLLLMKPITLESADEKQAWPGTLDQLTPPSAPCRCSANLLIFLPSQLSASCVHHGVW